MVSISISALSEDTHVSFEGDSEYYTVREILTAEQDSEIGVYKEESRTLHTIKLTKFKPNIKKILAMTFAEIERSLAVAIYGFEFKESSLYSMIELYLRNEEWNMPEDWYTETIASVTDKVLETYTEKFAEILHSQKVEHGVLDIENFSKEELDTLEGYINTIFERDIARDFWLYEKEVDYISK